MSHSIPSGHEVRSPLQRFLAPARLLPLLLVGGCANVALLDPKGPVGAQEKTILLNSLGIMLAIVVPTMIATLAVAWWFRASNRKAHYRPDWEFSGRIEMVVWSIPAMTILLLGGITWVGSHELDPPKPLASKVAALPVQVVSLDWKWLFIYPQQGIASVNRLVVPAGTPVSFQLTSATVMSNFFVPQLGTQIYTMPGMTTRLNLQADQPGTFHGISAHFNGDGFSDMHFNMDAVTPQQFAGWVADAKGKGPALDTAGYARLAQESKADKPMTYRTVAPNLFQQIAMQTAPIAETPHSGPAPHVMPLTDDKKGN